MTKTTYNGEIFVLQKNINKTSTQPIAVYHLSHDLRGPLNSILGFSELLLEGIEGPLNKNQEEDISAIYQSAQKLLSLINTVVDLSKLEANRLTLTTGLVDLTVIVNNILGYDFGIDKPADIELTANMPEKLLLSKGDSKRIEQMIVSFIKFAFKYKQANKITITTEVETTNAIIKVNIAGMVIPASKLEELFELVIKVDEAGRTKLGMGGIELPLTSQLAEQHNGKVWVESQLSGVNFFLSLPIYDL